MPDTSAPIFPTRQATPVTERLSDRKSRRMWLLVRALEDLPLHKALALAAAAEHFLCGDEA
jgi:hypothetical protein